MIKNNYIFLRLILRISILLIFVIIILYFNRYKIQERQKFIVPNLASKEAIEFYSWALNQIGVVTSYDHSNWYYNNWWFPPRDTWVCSDTIRRAFMEINIDLKKLVDDDIKANRGLYNTKFDSNINFRRVKNLDIFFKSKSKILTNELIQNNIENLSNWQIWDIIVFDALPPKNLWHIAIISNIRADNWIPFMLDNHWDWVNITITPLDWPTKIIGHYRYFK